MSSKRHSWAKQCIRSLPSCSVIERFRPLLDSCNGHIPCHPWAVRVRFSMRSRISSLDNRSLPFALVIVALALIRAGFFEDRVLPATAVPTKAIWAGFGGFPFLGFLVFCHWRTSCPVASRFVFAFTGGRSPGEGLSPALITRPGFFCALTGLKNNRLDGGASIAILKYVTRPFYPYLNLIDSASVVLYPYAMHRDGAD